MNYKTLAAAGAITIGVLTGCGKDPEPVKEEPKKIIIPGQEFTIDFRTNENYARAFGIMNAYADRKMSEAPEDEKDLERLTDGQRVLFANKMNINGIWGVEPSETEAFANGKDRYGRERTWAQKAVPATVTGNKFHYTEPDIAVDTEEDKKQFLYLVERFATLENKILAKAQDAFGANQTEYRLPAFTAKVKDWIVTAYRPEKIGNTVYLSKEILQRFTKSIEEWEEALEGKTKAPPKDESKPTGGTKWED